MKKATFGAGCFWGVEAAFQHILGVHSTKVGYMGGNLKNPTYEDVCTDKTGHAEVVQIKFEPMEISYEQLINIFWEIHDPTKLNRQGPDCGTQYRSVIFYHDQQQKKIADKSKKNKQESGEYKKQIVTEIVPAKEFYLAEEYHQKYLDKKGKLTCNY